MLSFPASNGGIQNALVHTFGSCQIHSGKIPTWMEKKTQTTTTPLIVTSDRCRNARQLSGCVSNTFPTEKALIKESTVGRKKGNMTGNRKGGWQTWSKRDREKEIKSKGTEGTNEPNEKAGRSSDCTFLLSLNLLLLQCHHYIRWNNWASDDCTVKCAKEKHKSLLLNNCVAVI